MKYAGIDLHKKTITVCVVDQTRRVLARRTFACAEVGTIREFFASLGTFRCVVEATAGYEWIARLLEPLADRFVLAHPGKLRIIAESTRKSDRFDARVLAEFLALDQVPEAHRPTPRQREHRRLVRHRDNVQRRITSLKNRLRHALADHNADVPGLFSASGRAYLKSVKLDAAARFVVDRTFREFEFQEGELRTAERELKAFARAGTVREREQRALLDTIPGVGFVTIEIVLAELADVDRFRSQKKAVAYAGLAPGQRESAGKRRDLGIEKTGSKLLRWSLVQAAWRLRRFSPRWRHAYESLREHVGRQRAIVAVARRLLCTMIAILSTGRPYDPAYAPPRGAAR